MLEMQIWLTLFLIFFKGSENSDKLIDLAIGNSSSNTTFSSEFLWCSKTYLTILNLDDEGYMHFLKMGQKQYWKVSFLGKSLTI